MATNAAIEINPTPIRLDKVVIVVGTTGVGKSTLINMLYNSDYSINNCKTPCPIDDTADAVTKKCQWIFNSQKGIVFGDTVGFGDSSMTDEEVALGLTYFISVLRNGVHSIILVVKYGRISSEVWSTIKALGKMFGERCYAQMMLILTHYEDYISKDCSDYDNKQKVIDKWVGTNSELRNLLTKIDDRVVLTNNNTCVCDTAEQSRRLLLRKHCLETLMLFAEHIHNVKPFVLRHIAC